MTDIYGYVELYISYNNMINLLYPTLRYDTKYPFLFV